MIKTIATWARRALIGLALCLPFASVAIAQTPYSTQTNAVFPAITFTATSQTSTPITLGQSPSGNGGSYQLGNITVTGSSLTTATLTVLGSSDGGNSYYALNISPINAPQTVATTVVITTPGIYQVNLSGLTNVKFQTSGTFTATSISIVLTAAPNGIIARGGPGGSGATSVSNADGTLTISPTTGVVVASLNLGHKNVWANSVEMGALGTAISGTNFNSNFFRYDASIWNGTAAILDQTQCENVAGAGTNPSIIFVCSADISAGSTGTHTAEWWNFNFLLQNTIAATSGANQPAPSLGFLGSVWNGAASTNDQWTVTPTLGTGTNPASTLVWSHTGSSGIANVQFPAIVINGGTPITSTSSANSQAITCPPSGTGTQYCGADGAWHSAGGSGANTYTGAQTAPAFLVTPLTGGIQAQLFDDFYVVSTVSVLPIGSPTTDTCTSGAATSINHPGLLSVNSGTVSGSGLNCAYNSGNGAGSLFTINDSLPWVWEVDAEIPVLPSTTAASYQLGMTHTTTTSPSVNGAYFYLSSANGTPNDWYCAFGATPTLTDTTIAQVATVYHRFTMESDGTNLHWYIDGTQVCGTGVALSGVTNTVQSVGLMSAVTNTVSTSVSMLVDYLLFQRAVTR